MPQYYNDIFSDWAAESTVSETGMISNVALCGNSSKNGYAIPEGAFGGHENARRLYEEKPVFINHSDGDSPFHRSVYDLAGTVKNVRMEGGRPRGEIHTIPTEAGKLLVVLAKSRRPEVGMSHVADYTYNPKRTAVEKINEVASVDVVVFPATTRTFSEQKERDTMADPNVTEMLQSQLRDQKESYEGRLKPLSDEVTALKAKVAILETESVTKAKTIADLTTERDGLKAKSDEFSAQVALANRRTSVEAKCKEHGLNLADKEICSETWLGSLMATADEAAREALIKDRAVIVKKAGVGGVPAGMLLSQERAGAAGASGNGEPVMNFESIMKGRDLFARR